MQFAKATYAAVVGFLGSLTTVMVGDIGFHDVSDGQWLAAALVGLVAAGGVYGIPYRPAGGGAG